MQGLALHFECGAGEPLAVLRDLHHFQAAGDFNRVAFPPVREVPMDLLSLKRRPSRQTDILEAPFFCHIDNYVHYH